MFLCLVFLMLSRLFIVCWERADLLALVGDVYCIFVTLPCGIPGQVWYLIVSFPDLCRLPYFCNQTCRMSINIHVLQLSDSVSNAYFEYLN